MYVDAYCAICTEEWSHGELTTSTTSDMSTPNTHTQTEVTAPRDRAERWEHAFRPCVPLVLALIAEQKKTTQIMQGHCTDYGDLFSATDVLQ